MVRAPCCAKMGLKKGPWTPEEDQILVSYIQINGHGNWRALPKQAGLLRCGKSCRLRWINYLRPDIKRGNFTREEEDTIISLHEKLGNGWSAIAAQLPGRTDNEIKNVWHTHLKKRLKQSQSTTSDVHVKHSITSPKCEQVNSNGNSEPANSSLPTHSVSKIPPQPSLSEQSLVTTCETNNNVDMLKCENQDYSSATTFPLIDESSWPSEKDLIDKYSLTPEFFNPLQDNFLFNSSNVVEPPRHANEGSCIDDDMDFWYNLLTDAGGIQEFL